MHKHCCQTPEVCKLLTHVQVTRCASGAWLGLSIVIMLTIMVKVLPKFTDSLQIGADDMQHY